MRRDVTGDAGLNLSLYERFRSFRTSSGTEDSSGLKEYSGRSSLYSQASVGGAGSYQVTGREPPDRLPRFHNFSETSGVAGDCAIVGTGGGAWSHQVTASERPDRLPRSHSLQGPLELQVIVQ